MDAHALVLSTHLSEVLSHPLHIVQVIESLINHLEQKQKKIELKINKNKFELKKQNKNKFELKNNNPYLTRQSKLL
jgi:hypothetical protein